MFSSHRHSYISQLSRSYPILRHVDIYDRQSFLRAYVLDNIYICILTYAIFYAALWYANTVIKRIEKSNRDLLKIVEENRTKLADVAALKNKKTEYEEVILKTKEAQQLTSKYLENEMQKLSSEIATAGDKMSELESLVKKTIFSTNLRGSQARGARRRETGSRQQTRNKGSRYSPRRFLHPSRRNRRRGSTGSLSADRLDNGDRIPGLHRRIYPRRSDLSNAASAEASSESAAPHGARILARRINYQDGDKRRRFYTKRILSRTNEQKSCCSLRKLHLDTLKNITPLTGSLLGLATIFLKEKH